MPVIKFDRVVSCSSEDPNHPAKNLLKTETYKKWKCKNPGEDQISVVLQLEKSSLISSVDIGNEHTAFVEVLVARSTGDAEDFKVLLVASSFMTPMESRSGEHPNRVRMFSRDQLSKPAVDERWDRVKVVCRQPFNRHVQYGLTFLKLHTSQEEKSEDTAARAHQTKLGRFVVREEDPDGDDIRVGSLFAVKHGATVPGGLLGGPHKAPPTGAAAIMDASKPAALALTVPSSRKQTPVIKTDKESSAKKKADTPAKDSPRPQKVPKETHRNGIVAGGSSSNKADNGKAISTEHSPFPKRVKMSDGRKIAAAINEAKTEEGAAAAPSAATARGAEKKVRAPFHRLLGGVTVVISGYQNPLRADLREAALEIGAKYRPDWGPGCTHLVCAFPNTPKFNQVKGQGKIVRKEWIEDCHSQRKRLPWRRYAMDKKDQVGPESDTEEENESAELDRGERTAPATSSSQSEESWDDNDENGERTEQVKLLQPNNKRPSLFAPLDGSRVKQTRTPAASQQSGGGEQERKRKLPPSPSAASASTVEEDCYDADTDVDEDVDGSASSPGGDLPPLPQLPNLFRGATFRLGPSLSDDTVEKLKRYITVYGGDVVSNVGSADYLVTDRIKDCEKLKFDHSRCTAVRPAWVWECNDTRKLTPTGPYELE